MCEKMMSRKGESENFVNYCTGMQKIISTSSITTSSISKEFYTNEFDAERVLLNLANFIEDIVIFYRITWQRDRELGYPGYRGASAKPTSSIEEHVNLQQEEITRLNTILPKLEESYITKLRDCCSSLVFKLRKMAARNPENFKRLVTSIQLRILTHKMHFGSGDFHCFSSNSNDIPLRDQELHVIKTEKFTESMQ